MHSRSWWLDGKTILTVLVIVVFGAGLILQLRALAAPTPAPRVIKVTDRSGLQVTCVVFGASRSGSCDWDHAVRP